MQDLFGDWDGGAPGDLPGGLRGEAAAALAQAKSACRRFGEDWYALHGLVSALRDPRVRFVPSSGEPEVRKALEAVVAATRGALALGGAAIARHGIDASAIAAAGREAEGTLRSMRGVVVTYGQVAEALEGRRGDGREAAARIARVRRALRDAEATANAAEPDGAPSPGPSP